MGGLGALTSAFATGGIFLNGYFERKERIIRSLECQIEDARQSVQQLLYEEKHDKSSDCTAFIRRTATRGKILQQAKINMKACKRMEKSVLSCCLYNRL